MTLLGSQPEPARRFGLVLENALAQGVHEPEVELRFGGSLLGVNEEPSYRCGIVATVHSCHSFVKCLRRRDRYAEQHSQQRQDDNAAPNRPFHLGDYITQGTAAAFPRTRSRRL